MKIAVLNGSPKGLTSVTMQYVAWLKKQFPEHQWNIHSVSQRIGKLELDQKAWDELMGELESADMILWGFPLYFLTVHSGYLRFIELLYERDARKILDAKPSAALSTSIHFYDHTAHNMIQAVNDDLGLRFLGGHSAHMQDLFNRKARYVFTEIFRGWLQQAEAAAPATLRAYAPVSYDVPNYKPGTPGKAAGTDNPGLKVTIVADPATENLKAMIARMRHHFPQAEVMDLRTLQIGRCLGCMHCGPRNECAYEKNAKDQFASWFREKVLTADIVIFAAPLITRYLSSIWQKYLERNFLRTHQPALSGKQTLFLVSGPLSQEHNTQEVLRSYAEGMGAPVTALISDEEEDSSRLDAALDQAAADLTRGAVEKIFRPDTFRGIGGKKLFRDEIFAGLKGLFQADNRYYKKSGYYDFPQKRRGMRFLSSLLILLCHIPGIRKGMQKNMKNGMIMRYQKFLERKA